MIVLDTNRVKSEYVNGFQYAKNVFPVSIEVFGDAEAAKLSRIGKVVIQYEPKTLEQLQREAIDSLCDDKSTESILYAVEAANDLRGWAERGEHVDFGGAYTSGTRVIVGVPYFVWKAIQAGTARASVEIHEKNKKTLREKRIEALKARWPFSAAELITDVIERVDAAHEESIDYDSAPLPVIYARKIISDWVAKQNS